MARDATRNGCGDIVMAATAGRPLYWRSLLRHVRLRDVGYGYDDSFWATATATFRVYSPYATTLTGYMPQYARQPERNRTRSGAAAAP